ncbi:hypothetical protein NEL38_06655 [Escherichia coli]|nr:hypothetical protein [Escherichia coli]
MLRIGQVEATATQDGKYTDGSVAGGIAATRLRAAAFNAMQEELAHIVESAGLALDINDMTQVLKAIQKLTLSRANPFADIKSDGAAAISTALTNLGLVDLAKTSASNTFTGDQKFTGGVSLPANTAYKGIGLQAWFDYKQDKDDTLTALSGKDVAGLLSYLGLTSAAKTDAKNTFTQKQTFSGSVALPSDTTLNGIGLESLFDSKLDASNALGTGQNWVDVTASRTAGVTYTNTTTRPICVSIPETADGQRGLYVGGVLTAFARGADSDSTLFAIVPPGAQYIFSGAFSSWAELR